MLGWRIAISAILIPAFVALCYFDAHMGAPARGLLALCLFLTVRGAYEMHELLRVRAIETRLWPMVVCCVFLILSGWQDVVAAEVPATERIVMTFTLSILFLFAVRAFAYRKPGNNMESLGAEILTIAYVGLLLAMTAQLRWVRGHEAGYLALGSLVICAKTGDIGAYTLGRLFGKRKMAPHLSPGKTWMGFVGAVLFSGLAGWAWLSFVPPLIKDAWSGPVWYVAVIFGTCLGLVGLLGDLCESLIKRDCEKKDSAQLMPGFGGLLDLIDSIIYAGPVAWLLWRFLPLLNVS